jgi:hypothetical protein
MTRDYMINSSYSKMINDLNWKQDLLVQGGVLAAMDEQRRMWELIHPYSVIQKHIDEMNSITNRFQEYKGITGIAASAIESYRVTFERDIGLIPKTIGSLIPESVRYLDGVYDRISNICKLEDSYKRALDHCNIDYILPSQRILDSFASIAAACNNSNSESSLARLSLYNSLPYQEYLYKQLYWLDRDDPDIATRRAIVTDLTGGIFASSEASIEIGCELFEYSDNKVENEIVESNKPNIYGVTNRNLGYIYKKNISVNVEQAFCSSIPTQINQLGCLIISQIYSINEMSYLKNNSYVFTTTNKSLMACSIIPTSIATNESCFAEVIDYLFFLIYEGSGTANRLVSLVDKDMLGPLWWVKYLRLEFRHDIQHGSEKEIVRKFKNIADTYMSLIGTERPRSQKEWMAAQLALYRQLFVMLETIHEKQ